MKLEPTVASEFTISATVLKELVDLEGKEARILIVQPVQPPRLQQVGPGRCLLHGLGLHPLVAQWVVRLARNAPAAPGRVQLLLIGNDTSLMRLQVLDRDDIWLSERESDGGTCVVPVSVRGPPQGQATRPRVPARPKSRHFA